MSILKIHVRKLFVSCLLIASLASSTAYSQRSDTTKIQVQIGQLRQCLLVNDSLQAFKQNTAILSHANKSLSDSLVLIQKQSERSSKRLKRRNRLTLALTVALGFFILY